jgi:D-aminopeptidase
MTMKSSLLLETADDHSGKDGPPALDEATQIVVAHLVAKETAALTAELATAKDALEVAQKALADKDTEFAAFKADLDAKAEVAKLTDTRKAEVAKALPTLEATEERAARWAAMNEVEFAAYLADVAAVAAPKTSGTESFDEKTAETAMDRSRKTTSEGSAARTVLGL